jgi:peptidyl-prolyl cis-trans isomerase D
MLTFFRRVSKSKIGTGVMAFVMVAILGGFALADLSNFGTGNLGLGMSSGTLARVGDQEVTEREMSDALQRRLQDARQQRPDADYASIIGDFGAILEALLDQRTLMAFADKYAFPISKRLIDAEISQLPNTKGLNGEFSEQAYRQFLAQQRLSDAEVRQILKGGLLQRLLLTPIATNARIPVGMATPYASMLLESREGEAAIVPADAFKAGLTPTDAQVQQYYGANRARYMIPEQRVLRVARIGPEQVAGVTATDQEVAAYYNANKATYAPSDTRSLSQVVVQDQATANAIAQRAKSGATLAAAAAPAGANAAVTTLKDQTREAYSGVAGAMATDAVKSAVVALPPARPIGARRIQIADAQGNVPPAMKILFTVGAGKAMMAPNPQGGGFFVVKNNKITPGNALNAPGLIGQVQSELNQAAAQDYAEQFVADLKRELKAKRNDSAIESFKARLLSSGG